MSLTAAERYQHDPFFRQLTDMLYYQFERCDQGGAGLTPTEVREACALAWQRYRERHISSLMVPRGPDRS